jgi:hypothetical protein
MQHCDVIIPIDAVPYVPTGVLDLDDEACQMAKHQSVHGYGIAWDPFHPSTKFQVIDWMEV